MRPSVFIFPVAGFLLLSSLPSAAGAEKSTEAVTFAEFLKIETTCRGTVVSEFPKEYTDCSRSIPEPTLAASNAQLHNLHMTRCIETSPGGSRIFTGIEKATLNDGSTVLIHNTGCEAFTLTYIFMLPTDTPPLSDTRYWYQEAADRLTQVATLSRPEFQAFARQSAQALVKRLQATEAPAFGEVFNPNPNNSEIQTFISITRAGQLPKGSGHYLEVQYSVSPL